MSCDCCGLLPSLYFVIRESKWRPPLCFTTSVKLLPNQRTFWFIWEEYNRSLVRGTIDRCPRLVNYLCVFRRVRTNISVLNLPVCHHVDLLFYTISWFFLLDSRYFSVFSLNLRTMISFLRLDLSDVWYIRKIYCKIFFVFLLLFF